MNSDAQTRPYFFSPKIDFLLIGGSSFIFLIVASLFLPRHGPLAEQIIALSFGVSFIINFPHFAFSYQLLYENITGKLRDKTLPLFYRAKLFNAAFIVPLLLTALIIFSLIKQSRPMMEYMLSIMTFFVGWHYVKQGYGMLMVMSAKNHFFFNKDEKLTILVHTYSAWLLSWGMMNRYNQLTNILYDIRAHRIMVPEPVLIVIAAAFVVTLIILVAEYVIRYFRKQKLPPMNAVVGYVAAIYLWNLALSVHPIFFAFIPALHSLQYTMFVVKYKKTERHEQATKDPSAFKSFFNPFTNFFLIAIALGAVGFFFIPYTLDYFFPLDAKTAGSSFFVFCFLIFINVHHYFIDNVIWRKENRNVRAYL